MRKILLILGLALLLPLSASAAVSNFGNGTFTAAASGDITPPLPASTVTDDILIVYCWTRSPTDTISVSGWTALANGATTAGAHYWFWKRHDGSETDPVCDAATAGANIYGRVYVFRGAKKTGNFWDAIGSFQADASNAVDLTGISTGAANDMVVAFSGYEDNNTASIITTGTDPAAYTEVYAEDIAGDDGSMTMSFAIRATAGATGTVSVTYNTGFTAGDEAGNLLIDIVPFVACDNTDFGNSYTCVLATAAEDVDSGDVTITPSAASGSGHMAVMAAFFCCNSSCDASCAGVTMTFENSAADSSTNAPSSCTALITNFQMECLGAFFSLSSGVTTYTCNASATVWYQRCHVSEWAVPAGTLSWDVDGFDSGSGTTATAALSGTTAQAVELIIGSSENAGNANETAGASFTEIEETVAGHMVEARVVTSTGSYSCTSTFSTAGWTASCGAIKSVAAAGGAPPKLTLMGVGD